MAGQPVACQYPIYVCGFWRLGGRRDSSTSSGYWLRLIRGAQLLCIRILTLPMKSHQVQHALVNLGHHDAWTDSTDES